MSEFRPDSDPLVLRLDRAARILCNTPEMRDSDDLMLVSALLTEAGNELARLRAALRWALDVGAQTYDTDNDGAVWAYSCGCCAERTPIPDDLRDVFKATFRPEESPC